MKPESCYGVRVAWKRRPRGTSIDRRTGDPIRWRDGISFHDAWPIIDPALLWPAPLEPLPSLLEQAVGGNLRVLSSPPVRHGKSTTLVRWIAWALRSNPERSFFYLGHSAQFVQRFSRECRRLAQNVGVELASDFNTITEWHTDAGGGAFWASTDQEVIGRGCDVAIFDDPLGWLESWDQKKRDQVDETISFVTTRLNAGGSVILNMSRQSTDDPIGRRLGGRAREWAYVNKRAIIDEGTDHESALWPEVRSLENLREIRTELRERGDERVWRAQYQGEPVADRGSLFVGLETWAGALPPVGRVVIGVDAAFSAGAAGDFFAAVVLAEWGDAAIVLEVVRHQRGTAAVMASLSELHARYPDARLVSYVSGPERGIYDTMAMLGCEVEQMRARWAKGIRARACAHAWETKRLLVRADRPWSRAFVAECQSFTGADDAHDDQVDALVSAYDGLQVGRPHAEFAGGFVFGRAGY